MKNYKILVSVYEELMLVYLIDEDKPSIQQVDSIFKSVFNKDISKTLSTSVSALKYYELDNTNRKIEKLSFKYIDKNTGLTITGYEDKFHSTGYVLNERIVEDLHSLLSLSVIDKDSYKQFLGKGCTTTTCNVITLKAITDNIDILKQQNYLVIKSDEVNLKFC